MQLIRLVSKVLIVVFILVNVAIARAMTSTATTTKLAESNTAYNTSSLPSLTKNSKSRTKITRQQKPDSFPNILIATKITRTTNIYELDDGTKNDNLNFEVAPTLQTSLGSFKTTIAYVQNLRGDKSTTVSDWNDVPFIYIFPFQDWVSNIDTVRLAFSLTAVAPLSKNSTQRDHLQTSLSGKCVFSVIPIEAGLTYSFGVTVGRSFHTYEEDTNDTALNQYFSNQNLSFGYKSLTWNLGLSLTNRWRLTYKNESSSTFELAEEIGYNINENTTLAIGHTNAGPTLKPNATDLNMDLYNENVSSLYATLGFSF